MSDEQQPKKRKPGRPKKTEAVCTPAVIDQIRSLYVRGKGVRVIAQLIGATPNAVQHQLTHTVKPMIRAEAVMDTGLQLARAEEIISICFEGFDRSLRPASKSREKYNVEKIKAKIKKTAPKALKVGKLLERTLETIERDGDKGWLELVLHAMDYITRVKGGYAPAQLRVHQQSEMRIAGLSPEQLDECMLRRLEQLRAERTQHAHLLETARRAAGQQN